MINLSRSEIEEKNPALPIYRRLAEGLRKQIISGTMQDASKLPSEAELSEQFGINLRTLRKSLKILSDQGLISQCQGRGTFVTYHLPEQRLRFGVIFSGTGNLNDLYPMRMLSALETTVSDNGSAELVLLRAVKPSMATLMEEINRTQCDGLVVFPNGNEQLLFQSEFDRIPMVFMNIERPVPVPENRFHVRLADGTVSDAVDYLYQLGHRKIGYIGSRSSNLQRRNLEFAAALKRLALSDAYTQLFEQCDITYDASQYAVSELWSRADHPTALLCPGVVYASGAWQGLMLQGVKIPEECSILGFDINSNTNPHFSSIVQPLELMARKTVELLIAQQGCGKMLKQRHYNFPAKISERGSCRALTNQTIFPNTFQTMKGVSK